MRNTISFLIMMTIFQPLAFADNCDNLESINWLAASWVAQTQKLTITESWRRISPKTWEGQGGTTVLSSQEQVTFESLRLVEMSGEVFYLAKVASNTFPVAFKLTRCSEKTAIFENSEHDFPKKLSYQLTGDNGLSVSVTGDNDEGFNLEYRRAKEGL